MNVKESIISALSSVLSNKMRSILTMLGIIIGISSVILITSIGNGFSAMFDDQFSKLGYNGLEISAQSNFNEEPISDKEKITLDDAEFLSRNEGIDSVSVVTYAQGKVTLKNPNETGVLNIYATDKEFINSKSIDIVSGRFLNDNDNIRENKVALIDENASKDIFGRKDSVGETIKIEIENEVYDFTVIGIIKSEDEEEGNAVTLVYEPTISYIPINTFLQISEYDKTFFLYSKVNDNYDAKDIAKEIQKLLGIKHGTDAERYMVTDISDIASTFSAIFSQVTAFISFVAGISLLVGGIGVMNIMLVTVTERTREIGIRKSLGATNGNIQFQFLIESIILTAIGGVIGIILGYLGGVAIGAQLDVEPRMSIPVVVVVVIISSLIGIVFGVYPANKAANLDPIDALRYE